MLRNVSETPAQFAVLRVYLPSHVKIVDSGNFAREPLQLSPVNLVNELFICGSEMLVYTVNVYSGSMPIWGALPFSAGKGAVLNLGHVGPDVIQKSHLIFWRIDVPNINPRVGANRIVRTNGVARVDDLKADSVALSKVFR